MSRWYVSRARRIRWKALKRGLRMIGRGVDCVTVTEYLEREETRAQRLEARVTT